MGKVCVGNMSLAHNFFYIVSLSSTLNLYYLRKPWRLSQVAQEALNVPCGNYCSTFIKDSVYLVVSGQQYLSLLSLKAHTFTKRIYFPESIDFLCAYTHKVYAISGNCLHEINMLKQEVSKIKNFTNPVLEMCISKTGEYLALLTGQNSLEILNLHHNDQTEIFSYELETPQSIIGMKWGGKGELLYISKNGVHSLEVLSEEGQEEELEFAFHFIAESEVRLEKLEECYDKVAVLSSRNVYAVTSCGLSKLGSADDLGVVSGKLAIIYQNEMRDIEGNLLSSVGFSAKFVCEEIAMDNGLLYISNNFSNFSILDFPVSIKELVYSYDQLYTHKKENTCINSKAKKILNKLPGNLKSKFFTESSAERHLLICRLLNNCFYYLTLKKITEFLPNYHYSKSPLTPKSKVPSKTPPRQVKHEKSPKPSPLIKSVEGRRSLSRSRTQDSIMQLAVDTVNLLAPKVPKKPTSPKQCPAHFQSLLCKDTHSLLEGDFPSILKGIILASGKDLSQVQWALDKGAQVLERRKSHWEAAELYFLGNKYEEAADALIQGGYWDDALYVAQLMDNKHEFFVKLADYAWDSSNYTMCAVALMQLQKYDKVLSILDEAGFKDLAMMLFNIFSDRNLISSTAKPK